ncbi:Gamma-glutamyltranspeptidase precursor [Aromatoleum aromaticum EbN1]|uniref:Glutathione hydrolase proenzyme n=1 Tax=Aromatoleum aromaticum (strain DSM 19018 / LMG 30748 / EbN1) TaxID=76114 RepID=Q5P4M1_AROAE|nr:gamma-glutamyltransferase [Aromatoleum aromaticum]CAI07741.1 Gamma-glutamyltranspeptidase precursor [Aromatoleum aromaticum EbN1]
MKRMDLAMYLARLGAALFVATAVLAPLALAAEGGSASATSIGVPQIDPAQATGSSAGNAASSRGVVSVSHPLAAAAGAQILEAGGNAIDAAAAIQFALNVVEPQFSGIGGGGFMMVHLAAENRTFIVDSREKAPAGASADMFLGQTFLAASTSGHSIGVPGTLKGIDYALRQWGSMTLAATLAPAIRLAEEGFRINRFLAADTYNVRTTLQPETRAIFRLPDGSPLPEGHLLVQPALAQTFRLIARDGVDPFYRGDIARAILDVQLRSQIGPAGAGRMTASDLAAYDVAVRQPVEGDYRGYTIKSMPPPSSGGLALLMMLELLEPFPLGSGDGWRFGGRDALHAMIEAMRLTFADRSVWMGDPDFVPVPVKGLLSECFLATRRAFINSGSRMATPLPGDPRACDSPNRRPHDELPRVPAEEEKSMHTTHFSVVDAAGNFVSYTSTTEHTWGTGILVPGYGFLLNNQLTDFNFTPQLSASTGNPGANDAGPFKRPLSSMAPTILFKDGKPLIAYGASGGPTIINTVLNITLNLVDHRMDIQQAIDAPRLSVTSAAGAVRCEAGLPPDSLRQLVELGHDLPDVAGVPVCNESIGSVQAVVIEMQNGRRYGGADQRSEGTVIALPR